MSRGKVFLLHVVSFCGSAVLVLPLYWAFIASLGRSGAPPAEMIVWWPREPQWQNYRTVFELIPMGRFLWNSLVVVLGAVPLTLLTASVAGFGLSQIESGRQRHILLWSVVWLMVPNTAVWVFRFQIFKWLGILNSPLALIFPAVGASSPLFVLLYYGHFRRVPRALFEAARLDGAGAWGAWWLIGVPLTRPTTAAVLVLSFALYWNDFVSPTLYLNDSLRYTAPVGLQFLLQMDSGNWPVLLAGSMILLGPMVGVFVLGVRGMTYEV